jgi:hypothetical protein
VQAVNHEIRLDSVDGVTSATNDCLARTASERGRLTRLGRVRGRRKPRRIVLMHYRDVQILEKMRAACRQ